MDIIRIKTVICLLLIRVTTSVEIDLVRYNQKSLTSEVYQSLQARSFLQCCTLCTIDPSCNSGDYNAGTAECRFSLTVGPSLIASMTGDTNFDAFGKIDCDLPACGCAESDDYQIGCFGDNWIRALSHRKDLPAMTPALCLNYCIDNGYAYAGLQAGYACFCGSATDNYAQYGVATNCDYTCSGDGNQLCGGHYANMVYSTC